MRFNGQFNEWLRNEADDGGDGGGAGSSLIDDSSPAPASTGGDQGGQAPAAASVATSQASSDQFDIRALIGDDGRWVDGWIDKLPEDLREHRKHYEKYQTPLHALQHTRNLQQLVGKKQDAVVIPDADADREAWKPVLEKLGVPETPDGYGLKVPDDLPEGIQVSQEELNEFAGFAHELGLTPAQVSKLQQYDLQRASKMVEGSAEQAAAIEAQAFNQQKEILRQAWGTGPEATKKHALAERAALTAGFTTEDIRGENADPIFRNAKVVQAFAKLGEMMSEDRLATGSESSPHTGQAAALDIIQNEGNPLYKKYHAGDEGVRAQVQAMLKQGR